MLRADTPRPNRDSVDADNPHVSDLPRYSDRDVTARGISGREQPQFIAGC
jgi:hypothetical protein